MALTQRLEFRQSQSLVMTPQLMQAIKLLQLSNLDLSAFVEEELERNPLLERASDGTEPPVGPAPVHQPVLRVVGVGGAGVNAVNRMVEAQVEGVEFIAVNTDLQSLQQSRADVTLHIGGQVTRGLGSGSRLGRGEGLTGGFGRAGGPAAPRGAFGHGGRG